jgi:hypothetical protein
MFCLLVNSLYRLNVWFDNKEHVKIFVLITGILAGNILIFASDTIVGLISGISVYILIFSLVILRIFFQNGYLKFNSDVYKIPVVGERIIVTRKFYWDGSFKKFINKSDPSRKPWWYTIRNGSEFVVVDISELKCDWKMTLSSQWVDGVIVINYFESRNYWRNKSDIRNEKLKKIGI